MITLLITFQRFVYSFLSFVICRSVLIQASPNRLRPKGSISRSLHSALSPSPFASLIPSFRFLIDRASSSSIFVVLVGKFHRGVFFLFAVLRCWEVELLFHSILIVPPRSVIPRAGSLPLFVFFFACSV